MTKKEMDELSDLIIVKLVKMQAELDKAFFENAEKLKLNDIEIIDAQELTATKADLEHRLQEALDNEDYELAQSIQDVLKEYKKGR